MGSYRPSWKLHNWFIVVITGIFLISSVLIVILINSQFKKSALAEAKEKADILLARNLATHSYINKHLKPKLFELMADLQVDKDYFEPSWMSSTYAVRNIDDYFKLQTKAEYYYKECAINARSPENEANEMERSFITELNNNPKLVERSFIKDFNGEAYFVVLRRGEVMEEFCLRCHSTPDQAPGKMVQLYGPTRSFNRHLGEVVSAISIRVPLAAAYANTNSFVLRLSGLLLILFLTVFVLEGIASNYFLFKPIKLMSMKATQIASDRKHLGETIEIKHGQELSELAKAFNYMSVNLKTTYDSQEKIIAERTARIEETKRLLEEDIEKRKLVEAELLKAKEEAEQAHAEMEKIAATDYLTGLLNRRAFMELLKAEFQRCKRNNQFLGIVIADIDNFKKINDQFGHPFGDKVLKIFAETIAKDSRAYDFLGRFGGEEFILCLPEVTKEELLKIGERIREEVQNLKIPVDLPGGFLQLTASFGAALLAFNEPDSEQAIDAVISKADKALYHAKALGKNQVAFGE